MHEMPFKQLVGIRQGIGGGEDPRNSTLWWRKLETENRSSQFCSATQLLLDLGNSHALSKPGIAHEEIMTVSCQPHRTCVRPERDDSCELLCKL